MLCIHWHETLGSSNDEAARLAREGAREGTVVWAITQTVARGQRGRIWQCAPGNVHMTVVLRPDLPVARVGRIAVACGLAAACVLQEATGFSVQTKWPNDIYLQGRKLGGILVETKAGVGGLEWAVAGIGVNVASHPDVLPPGHPATSLAVHGWNGTADSLIAPLATAMVDAARHAATEEGWATIARRWTETDAAAGPITVLEHGCARRAIGIGLDDAGALLAEREGQVERVTASEVSIRTTAGSNYSALAMSDVPSMSF